MRKHQYPAYYRPSSADSGSHHERKQMAQTYRLAGTQDPASRIDRWVVEGPSEDFPEGKVLELGGSPLELSDAQYTVGSRFVRLEPVKAEKESQVQLVDQPGVNLVSLSTDNPPDPGTAPDVGSLSKDELVAELDRVRASDPSALADVSSSAKKEDLQKALRDHYGQGA
jgi:hypothetical protein